MYTATHTIWLRHMRKFFRNREELGGLLIQPILWVALFGIGMGRMLPGDGDYVSFMLPGILALTALGSATGGGMMFLDERLRGILREYQVAPIPRLSILLGHILATVSKSFFQIFIVLIVAFVAGARISGDIGNLAMSVVALILFAVGFASIALAVAMRSKSIMGYHGMIFLFNLPMLFASNALYPLENVPTWMRWLAMFNPATWYIEVARPAFAVHSPIMSSFIALTLLCAFVAWSIQIALSRFRAMTT